MLAAIVAVGEVPLAAQDASGALRAESAKVRALMTRGMERSGTFRDLTSRLSAADVVVYVRFSRCQGTLADASYGHRPCPAFGGFSSSSTNSAARRMNSRRCSHTNCNMRSKLPMRRRYGTWTPSRRHSRGAAGKGHTDSRTAQAMEITKRVAAELGSTREPRPVYPPGRSGAKLLKSGDAPFPTYSRVSTPAVPLERVVAVQWNVVWLQPPLAADPR